MSKKPKKAKKDKRLTTRELLRNKAEREKRQELFGAQFGAYAEAGDVSLTSEDALTSIAIRQARDLATVARLAHAMNRAVTDFINNCPRCLQLGNAGVEFPNTQTGQAVSVSGGGGGGALRSVTVVGRPIMPQTRIVTAKKPKRRR